MTTKTIKTILFASLLVAMILPFSVMDMAHADKGDKQTNDKLKKDTELFIEADNIEKKHNKGFKYDREGKNASGQSNDHKRHQKIVEELNSRGIFHKSQDQTLMMATIETSSSSQTADIYLMSPEVSEIETLDSVCCGSSHNKKLKIKAGIEWNSPSFPWWEYRVESSWSSWTNTSIAKTTTMTSDENNVRPYVTVKADHAITYADFQVGSEVKIMDQNGNLISLGLNTGTYSNIYFPYLWTERTGIFPTVGYLSDDSTHTTEIQITDIS